MVAQVVCGKSVSHEQTSVTFWVVEKGAHGVWGILGHWIAKKMRYRVIWAQAGDQVKIASFTVAPRCTAVLPAYSVCHGLPLEEVANHRVRHPADKGPTR